MATNDKSDTVTIDLKAIAGPAALILSALIIGLCMIISANILAGGGGLKVLSATTSSAVSSAAASAGTTIDTGSIMSTSIDNNAVLGDKTKAKVAVVEFSDFECPYCKSFQQTTMPSVQKDYIDTGKIVFVYRYFPLSFHEPAASIEAEAGECVHQMAGETAFYKIHDKMFSTTQGNGAGLTMDQLGTMAAGIGGINVADMKTCITNKQYQAKITADTNAAAAIGISGTPGFVVGKLASDGTVTGEYISGAQDYSVFQTAINKYL